MITITSQQKRELKAQSHSLKPTIIVGNNGLTDAVLSEIHRALEDHELIKIRFNEKDRELREEIVTKICKKNKAVLIQSIGHIIAIYRKSAVEKPAKIS